MKLHKKIALASTLALAAAGALAAPYNIGLMPLAPMVYNNTVTGLPVGPFSHDYDFLFPLLGADASASAITIDVLTFLNIDNIQVNLYDSLNMLVASGTIGDASVLFNESLIGGSMYRYTVTGLVTGSTGGAYSFLASASQRASPDAVGVPEPASLALVLAALAAGGLTTSRRQAC